LKLLPQTPFPFHSLSVCKL